MVMDHRERDKRIIAHLAAYRVSLQAAMTRLYFGGKPERASNVLSRLKQSGYITSHPLSQKTRLVYYQLDGRSVREFGFPEQRATPFDGGALERHLGIMWWCCMSGKIRYRIEPEKAARVVGCESLRGAHVLQDADHIPRLYRVLHVGNKVNKSALHQLREAIRESLLVPELVEWISHQRYSFVLLVNESPKAKILRTEVQSEEFRREYEPRPHVRVHRVASPSTAHGMINEYARQR